MLNYAYAVLESRVRSEIVASGYDPMIGYLHSFDKDRAALVFDLMEPLRPVADREVLTIVQSRVLDAADFTIRTDGVCRLNPQLAKHLVMSVSSKLGALRSIHTSFNQKPMLKMVYSASKPPE